MRNRAPRQSVTFPRQPAEATGALSLPPFGCIQTQYPHGRLKICFNIMGCCSTHCLSDKNVC